MGIAIIGGLIIGFFTNDWIGRLVLTGVIGAIGCIELFFVQRKRPLRPRHWDAMRSQGMTDEEIDKVEEALGHASRKPFDEIGISGWKLYAWQFIWSTLTALPFSIIGGLIRVFLYDN